MDKDAALKLIAAGESQSIEFKESPATIKKATQTLAAFGSQAAGGTVFIGIRDGGDPVKGFQVGDNRPEQLASSIKRDTVSMVTAEPLLPEIYVFEDPAFIAIHVTPDTSASGPFLAFGERFERVGKSTHRVDMNYRHLAQAFQRHLYDFDAKEPLAFRFCESCGSEKLERSDAIDPQRDEVYYFVECADCGWTEWTQ